MYLQAQRNNQEGDAENYDVNPPPPRTMSFCLCAKSSWLRRNWLSRLNLIRIVCLLGIVVMRPVLSERSAHGENKCVILITEDVSKGIRRRRTFTQDAERNEEEKKRQCGGDVEL